MIRGDPLNDREAPGQVYQVVTKVITAPKSSPSSEVPSAFPLLPVQDGSRPPRGWSIGRWGDAPQERARQQSIFRKRQLGLKGEGVKRNSTLGFFFFKAAAKHQTPSLTADSHTLPMMVQYRKKPQAEDRRGR